MSLTSLPRTIDPAKLATENASFRGVLLQQDRERLRSVILEADGQINVDVKFGIDGQGIKVMLGHVATELSLECQRCAQKFGYRMDFEFALAVVHGDAEAKRLPDSYEPLIFTGEPLDLPSIIEDEILLNLPLVTMHKADQCPVQLPVHLAVNKEDGEEREEKENPFKVLERFKTDKH